jgi:hypothetical protein
MSTIALAYRIVLLSVRRKRCQEVPSVICDPALRHHPLPVRHVCIVSECENACDWELGREEALRPRLGGTIDGPGLFAVTRQAMDEHDTRSVSGRGKLKAKGGGRTRQ